MLTAELYIIKVKTFATVALYAMNKKQTIWLLENAKMLTCSTKVRQENEYLVSKTDNNIMIDLIVTKEIRFTMV
jgi:hypothetical protein